MSMASFQFYFMIIKFFQNDKKIKENGENIAFIDLLLILCIYMSQHRAEMVITRIPVPIGAHNLKGRKTEYPEEIHTNTGRT